MLDPETGERYDDVIVFWVASEDDKQAMVLDPGSPYFTTPHFDGHLSVLLRGSRIGEIDVEELTELVQDAWLSRASRRRGEQWLASRPLGSPGGLARAPLPSRASRSTAAGRRSPSAVATSANFGETKARPIRVPITPPTRAMPASSLANSPESHMAAPAHSIETPSGP